MRSKAEDQLGQKTSKVIDLLFDKTFKEFEVQFLLDLTLSQTIQTENVPRNTSAENVRVDINRQVLQLKREDQKELTLGVIEHGLFRTMRQSAKTIRPTGAQNISVHRSLQSSNT